MQLLFRCVPFEERTNEISGVVVSSSIPLLRSPLFLLNTGKTNRLVFRTEMYEASDRSELFLKHLEVFLNEIVFQSRQLKSRESDDFTSVYCTQLLNINAIAMTTRAL